MTGVTVTVKYMTVGVVVEVSLVVVLVLVVDNSVVVLEVPAATLVEDVMLVVLEGRVTVGVVLEERVTIGVEDIMLEERIVGVGDPIVRGGGLIILDEVVELTGRKAGLKVVDPLRDWLVVVFRTGHPEGPVSRWTGQ